MCTDVILYFIQTRCKYFQLVECASGVVLLLLCYTLNILPHTRREPRTIIPCNSLSTTLNIRHIPWLWHSLNNYISLPECWNPIRMSYVDELLFAVMFYGSTKRAINTDAVVTNDKHETSSTQESSGDEMCMCVNNRC